MNRRKKNEIILLKHLKKIQLNLELQFNSKFTKEWKRENFSDEHFFGE